MSLLNPSLPPAYIYTPYYCEENVYLLVESFSKDRSITDNWEIYAVFISNHTKTVALWNQKLCESPDYPVVWDYHCVLLLKSKASSSSWIFDYDTRLAMLCPLQEYVEGTLGTDLFQSNPSNQFRSLLRIVPAVDYLDSFASDRSHMLMVKDDGTQTYIDPPPSYPCLIGKRVQEQNITNNLMDTFVSMSSSSSLECIGQVMTFSEFCSWTSISITE